MVCRICKQEFYDSEMKGKGKLYCSDCFEKRRVFLASRKYKLELLKSMPLEAKILKSKILIREAVDFYGINSIYLSYSGGKDSTVLSHIVREEYPDMLHIFSNTTCEYPETIKHIKWENNNNGMNLIVVSPYDKNGKAWTFERVVNEYGYPMFSKSIANAIRTYRHAQSEETRQHSIDYINRRFKKYCMYVDCNISDRCCEKLKKDPIKHMARKLNMGCTIIGTLTEESRDRELDWINYGCNVFGQKKDNQCRPLSFWTEKDIYEYIEKYNVKISDLYDMGYERNGCMFCGFGIQFENGENRFQRLANTHPSVYRYLITHFKEILDSCGIQY